MMKQEPELKAHKAPSFYSPNTQSICLTSWLLHRSTFKRKPSTWSILVFAGYVTVWYNTTPHKLTGTLILIDIKSFNQYESIHQTSMHILPTRQMSVLHLQTQ